MHRIAISLFFACALSACINPQIYTTVQHQVVSLQPESLQTYGIAFITPSTVTGQEEDKQSLALTFAQVLAEKRPDIKVITLPETLSIIALSGLTKEYKAMFND